LSIRCKIHSKIFIKGIIQDFSLRDIISGNVLFGLWKADNDLWTVVFVDVQIRRLLDRRERKVVLERLEVFAFEKHFIFAIAICMTFLFALLHIGNLNLPKR
jgi:hypothetical protein